MDYYPLFDTPAARLHFVTQLTGMTYYEFAYFLKINSPKFDTAALLEILTGRKPLDPRTAEVIHNVYPSLSYQWLSFGEGPILLQKGK